jgi:Ran GTPase-activating protein (RanGAP) involved in mRNA processing and transport
MKAVRNRQIGTLVELDLSGNKIEVNGGQAVASVIEISPNLKTLNVSGCQMQAAAGICLLNSERFLLFM